MKRLLLLWLLLFSLLSLQAAPERAGDEPVRKNYLMAHVGLFPTDYGIYHSIPDSDQGNFVGSFRYFGPIFGITYGRQFNDFLAAEGYLFLSFITRTDMPEELTVYDYLTTRYGAGAGLIVTPLGRWFRFLKVGAVLGYVREDTRSEWNNGQTDFRQTISSNNFAINYPLRLYALDGPHYALCAEVNLQCQYENGVYRRRTVNYTVNFAYKF